MRYDQHCAAVLIPNRGPTIGSVGAHGRWRNEPSSNGRIVFIVSFFLFFSFFRVFVRVFVRVRVRVCVFSLSLSLAPTCIDRTYSV